MASSDAASGAEEPTSAPAPASSAPRSAPSPMGGIAEPEVPQPDPDWKPEPYGAGSKCSICKGIIEDDDEEDRLHVEKSTRVGGGRGPAGCVEVFSEVSQSAALEDRIFSC